METITLPIAGTEVGFQLREPHGEHAFFVLGVRKSGSTLLNTIIATMAHANKVPLVNVGGAFFNANLRTTDWIRESSVVSLLRPGHVYGGFRDYPEAFVDSPLFLESPKLLMVRDPRDALCSEYFSTAYSHKIPEGDTSAGAAALMLSQREKALATPIETYVVERAPQMRRTLLAFIPALTLPRMQLVRYEDVILDKRLLIDAIARHFGWRCPDALRQAILDRVDVRPSTENPQAFTRRVTPGDHREKLTPETIRRLNTILAPVMGPFGYV